MSTTCEQFVVSNQKNGNTTVKFLANGKARNIVFLKGSEALDHFNKIYNHFRLSVPYTSTETNVLNTIEYMRKQYRFTVNSNNPQYFYPERKTAAAQPAA